MKKRNFKELKKEELKTIKGGDRVVWGEGDDVIIEYSLPIDPKLLEKKD